jgi:hypothetical protein
MRRQLTRLAIAALLAASPALAVDMFGRDREPEKQDHQGRDQSIQLGPRPFYLVDKMSPSRLKSLLQVLPTRGTGSPEFYYQTTLDALHNDGDILVTLDVLARQVGILGIFSDWSATVTYYANCMGLP